MNAPFRILLLLTLLSLACFDDGRPTEEWSGASSYSSCPVCPDQSDFIDDLVAEREAEEAAVAMSVTAEEDFEGDINKCYQVGQMDWEDEGDDPDGGFNCRDFTRWFIECMNELGHDAEGLSMYCKNCDSGSARGHRIVMYQKPNGDWCPGEPQLESGGELGDCCDSDKDTASECALEDHCDTSYDACCEPDEFKPRTPDYCKKEKCRYEIDVNGEPRLNCDLPVIGSGSNAVPPGDGPSDPPDECEQAIKACLDAEPASCDDCKKENIPECNDPDDCKDETTNEACTGCCIDSTSNHADKIACLTSAGCAGKPSAY